MNKLVTTAGLILFGLIVCIHQSSAQTCGAPNPDCPDYNRLPAAPLPPNSNIQLEETTAAPNNTVAGALNAAAADMNSQSTNNGTGNTIAYGTITLVPNTPASATVPTIVVTFDTTTTDTTAACGGNQCSALTQLNNNPGAGVTSSVCHVTVFLAQVSQGVAAYNPNLPNYASSIQRSLEHEFSHCDGIGDAVAPTNTSPNYAAQQSAFDASIMSPYIIPNDGTKPSTPSSCDTAALAAVVSQNKTGSVCPVP